LPPATLLRQFLLADGGQFVLTHLDGDGKGGIFGDSVQNFFNICGRLGFSVFTFGDLKLPAAIPSAAK